MTAGPLRQRAYEHIHRMIATGELAAGSQVSELSLARRIGISRTPVREAIRRLAAEGLVEQVPRFGTIVRTPDRRELAELYEIREALEGYAAGKAAAAVGQADLVILQGLCDEMAVVGREVRHRGVRAAEGDLLERFLAADLGFHLVVLRAAGNRRLARLTADTQVLTRIFGLRRQTHHLPVIRDAYRFHRRVLRALAAHDTAGARRWVARHIRRSKKETLEHFDPATTTSTNVRLTLPADLREHLDRIGAELGTCFTE